MNGYVIVTLCILNSQTSILKKNQTRAQISLQPDPETVGKDLLFQTYK